MFFRFIIMERSIARAQRCTMEIDFGAEPQHMPRIVMRHGVTVPAVSDVI